LPKLIKCHWLSLKIQAKLPCCTSTSEQSYLVVHLHQVNFYSFTIYYLKLKHRLENDGPLLIKLPIHPSTIEELALIRFWLLKLSQTHFEELYANQDILNPEFLSVLNPRAGPRKILFHANNVIVGYQDTAILDFAQFLCAKRIVLRITLIDESHRNNIFRFITGTGNALEYFRIHSYVANQGEFCEFLVKVNFGNSFLYFPNLMI
jgi:hypothetical protein